MPNPYQVIKTIALTEKGTELLEFNQYTFVVDPKADKHTIKTAVEYLFERKVKAVNVMNRRGKTRRNKFGVGKRPDWKRAIVTLKDGEQPIDVFT
jgi:large subunit ribosomal protein L23